MDNKEGTGSLVCGTIGLVVSIISFIVCGWMGFIGLILGIVGLAMPSDTFGKKVPALISLVAGTISGILWAVIVSAMGV